MLVGEAGIGKSRLARELVKEADAAGMLVLRGRAVQGVAKSPFRPLAEAWRRWWTSSLAPASTLDPWLPALAAVVPGLRAPHPGPGDASDAARASLSCERCHRWSTDVAVCSCSRICIGRTPTRSLWSSISRTTCIGRP